MKRKQKAPIQKVNTIELGDLTLTSTDHNLNEVVSMALGVLRDEEVKSYLNVLKVSKQLKDGKSYYG